MSGLFDKAKNMVSGENAEKLADAVEKNVTEEKVDGLLGKVPGGDKLTDKTPADLNTKLGDAIRDNLGDKKTKP